MPPPHPLFWGQIMQKGGRLRPQRGRPHCQSWSIPSCSGRRPPPGASHQMWNSHHIYIAVVLMAYLKPRLTSFPSRVCPTACFSIKPMSQTNALLAIKRVSISYCSTCTPPAVALLHMGAFASTPTRPPKWAFDINLLEYMSMQFLFGVPNMMAWCNATSAFLQSCGAAAVPSPVCTLNLLAAYSY